MAGMVPKHQWYGTWVYPPIGVALAMMVLEEIEVYISPRQNIVAQYIATRPIMELCLAAERKPGMRLSRQWWEYPALDILGIRAGRASVEEGEYVIGELRGRNTMIEEPETFLWRFGG